MGGDSTSIKAALSDDKSLAAVAISSSEQQQQQQRKAIQVYQVENGLLQTTLTAKLKSQSFDKILFCGKDHVIALSKCSSSSSNSAATNSSTGQVFIWDLSRGGVVANSLADESSRKQYLDAASTATHLYLLVAVSGSTSGSSRKSSGVGGDDSDNEGGSKANKLQVHQYDPSTGRLTRKIKCGKCGDLDSELGLAVHEEGAGGKVQLILRNSSNSHHEAFRVLDAETGSKLGKHKYRDGKKQAKKEGTGGSGILIAGSIVAIPRISSVAIYNIKTSKWLKTIPAKSSNPQVQVWKTMEGEDGTSLLLVDQELYKCESNGVESISKVQSDYSLALLPRSTYQVAAVLHNSKAPKNSIQIQLVDWGKEDLTQNSDALGLFQPEITIQWETLDENNATSDKDRSSKKRNAESMTLLGAGQAGGESTSVSERKGQKKPKQDLDDDVAEDMDVDVDNNNNNDQNMSIADRLKKLSQVMDNKAGDEDSADEEKRDATNGKRDRSNSFVPKRATTESLTQLLSQALRGGDDQLLELALAVKDKAVLQETFKGLDNYSIEILLTKLTTRLASKPQRAEDLAFWLSHVLQSGRVRRMSQLQPLKNLLQDRIEAFPHLLRLEGRLSMIRSEGKGGPLGKKQMKVAK